MFRNLTLSANDATCAFSRESAVFGEYGPVSLELPHGQADSECVELICFHHGLTLGGLTDSDTEPCRRAPAAPPVGWECLHLHWKINGSDSVRALRELPRLRHISVGS